MEAYEFLGYIDLAQKIATRILDRIKTSDEGDAQETLTIIKIALHIKSLQGASQPIRTALDK